MYGVPDEIAYGYIEAGIEWIEQHQPGAVDGIDIERLDVTSCYDCPLGQVFGAYFQAPLPNNVYEHAFLPISSTDYKRLNAAWKEVLEKRREEGFGR